MILDTLTKHNIPIADCRGQGYDNESNISGSYKGAQAHIQQINPLAKFAPCTCHSLNLCGVHAAECCPEVITFFGVVQKLYNIFSSSPQRWEILTKSIGCSIHNLSDTRWSARVDSVRPFAAHLPGLKEAVVLIQELNLTAETRSEVRGIQTYLDSFESILMASIWFKVLTAINFRSTVLQARNATLDVEVDNIQSLIQDLKQLRDSWDTILAESKLVAGGMNVRMSLITAEKRRRVRKRFPDDTQEEDIEFDPENQFKHNVFYTLLDCIIGNLMTRYEAAQELVALFGFVWAYQNMDEEELRSKAGALCEKYSADISEDFVTEMLQLKAIHTANLGEKRLSPLDLLNSLHGMRLDALFPNIMAVLRIFCTLPVSVAQAERSFSTLARVKNVLRSTMCQDRLTSLGVLAVEAPLAKSINLDAVIEHFADSKARKAPMFPV